MLADPKRYEIDHRTIKLLVGLIALSLATVTSVLSGSPPIESISASYHEGGWPRDFFIGSLFAISAFLLAYNGKTKKEMVLSKVAAVAAMGVALFPCRCGDHAEIVRGVHAVSAGVMFIILAAFCFIFRRRALDKGHAEAGRRARIYALCGVTIVVSVVVIALDFATRRAISASIARLVFYGEAAALGAFGVAWLSASRVFPGIASKDERFSPFRDQAA